jgi:hypothetical protein
VHGIESGSDGDEVHELALTAQLVYWMHAGCMEEVMNASFYVNLFYEMAKTQISR